MAKRPKHWCFISKDRRDEYLHAAVVRGLQVERGQVQGGVTFRYIGDAPGGPPDSVYPHLLYTVVDVDRRTGKALGSE